MIDEADRNKDGMIDYQEWQTMGAFMLFFFVSMDDKLNGMAVPQIKKRLPLAAKHLEQVMHNSSTGTVQLMC